MKEKLIQIWAPVLLAFSIWLNFVRPADLEAELISLLILLVSSITQFYVIHTVAKRYLKSQNAVPKNYWLYSALFYLPISLSFLLRYYFILQDKGPYSFNSWAIYLTGLVFGALLYFLLTIKKANRDLDVPVAAIFIFVVPGGLLNALVGLILSLVLL